MVDSTPDVTGAVERAVFMFARHLPDISGPGISAAADKGIPGVANIYLRRGETGVGPGRR